MKPLKDRLLDYYGLSQEDYAPLTREPSFSSIPQIGNELAVKTAIERVRSAIDNDEKVIVYGDYDTDGIMATSIIVRCFHLLHKGVSFFIPSRYLDSYGLTMENAKNIVSSGFSLVILVDNGVSCLQEVSYLLSQGVQTIIIDHHDLPSILPPSVATIHPDLLPYGDYPVSAGYLCFLFSVCLLGKMDEYLLTLGAISTISDCMPMKGHNREIVALSLRYIRKNAYREIMTLVGGSFVDENILSMTVIPCINAIGRMVEDHKINRLVHYFADLNENGKPAIAEWMKAVNEERKAATAAGLERMRVESDKPAIVVVGHLLEGLNGLVANRLLSQYGKPIAVFSSAKTDPSLYVGSLRSGEGFNVMEFEASAKHLIVKGGGHAHAGGVSIRKEDYGAFKSAFETYAFRHPIVKREPDPIPLSLSEVNMESYREIRRFGPFGHDYEAPRFLIEGLPVSSLQFTRDGRFLSHPLGNGVKLHSFSYGKPSIGAGDVTVSLKGRMILEEYKGKVSLVFRCEKA